MRKEEEVSTEGNNFLLEDERKIVLKQPVQKILGCCPMFNNTYFVLAMKSIRQQMVVLYGADGSILKQHVFDDSNLMPYVILSDREVAWVDNDKDMIFQWNLQTYDLLKFDFKYNNDTADTHDIFIFPETKLICIVEYGRHDSNFFRLTYFNYPLTKESQPVHIYESNDVWTYEHTVRRANVRSMFTWFKAAHKEEVEFKSYELIANPDKTWEGKFMHHKAKNPFKAANGTCELSVGNVWEMTPHKFLIVSITDRPHTETEWPNALFVYEADHDIFREAKFAFDGKFRFQYIHYYSFGTTAMIRSFDFEKGQALETPVYYIDNENECIAAKGTWICSYLHKFCLPGFDANMIIDNQYENGDVSQIRSKLIKVADPKEMIVHMLEKYIPGVDEDLVLEITNILEFKK